MNILKIMECHKKLMKCKTRDEIDIVLNKLSLADAKELLVIFVCAEQTILRMPTSFT